MKCPDCNKELIEFQENYLTCPNCSKTFTFDTLTNDLLVDISTGKVYDKKGEIL